MKNQEQLEILLNKYLDHQCTTEEIHYLLDYFDIPQNEEALKSYIFRYFDQPENAANLAKPDFAKSEVETTVRAVHNNLLSQIRTRRVPVIRKLKWLRVAAALILLAASTAIFLYFQKDRSHSTTTLQATHNDIAPGGNKAVLTLGDGTQILLDDANEGELARQAGISISKTADGQLLYNTTENFNQGNAVVAYNKIETPRGGEYQVVLPDGTQVWLNAASSLRFPAAFTEKERRVELTGEAYFEVTHAGSAENANRPFIVITNRQIVEVLGTRFNINAYPEEAAVTTTLAEGSIKVSKQVSSGKAASPGDQSGSIVLMPGQQSLLTDTSNTIHIQNADIETALAWKNGDFIFNEEDLPSIMRKVARWYNIEVDFQGSHGDVTFTGRISRSRNLSAVLNTMELTEKVQFSVKGRRVTVIH